MSSRSLRLVPSLLLAMCLVGCGGDVATLVPVKGKVIVDGQELDGVVVTFIPEISKKNIRGGIAKTGSTGAFEVKSLDNDAPGLPAGKYTVAYSRRRLPDGTAAPEHGVKGPADPGIVQVETLPSYLVTPDSAIPSNQVEIPKDGKIDLVLKVDTQFSPGIMGPG